MLVALMSFVCYALIGLMPGDPIDLMLSADPRLTPDDVARLKAIHGLDQPILERYLAWLGKALTASNRPSAAQSAATAATAPAATPGRSIAPRTLVS